MPDGITIGPIKIYFYGIIIMLGVLAAVWIAIKEAERRNLDSEYVWDMVPWLLVSWNCGRAFVACFHAFGIHGCRPGLLFLQPTADTEYP